MCAKNDILRLAEEHHDCEFHCFTNGTLIDEEFCEAVQKLGNISFSLSLEGFEEVNDGRRGEGIFDKVLAAMDLMKKARSAFLVLPSATQEQTSRPLQVTSSWIF